MSVSDKSKATHGDEQWKNGVDEFLINFPKSFGGSPSLFGMGDIHNVSDLIAELKSDPNQVIWKKIDLSTQNLLTGQISEWEKKTYLVKAFNDIIQDESPNESRIRQELEEKYEKYIEKANQFPFDSAKLLIECALFSYKPPNEVIKQLDQIPVETIKAYEYFQAEGKVDTHAFGLVLEDDIILAFRGTQGQRNIFSDMCLWRKPLLNFDGEKYKYSIKAHNGFVTCLDSIWSEETPARKEIKEIKSKGYTSGMSVTEFLRIFATDNPELATIERKKRKIWLTGHSMGGAIATIAAARIALSPEFQGQVAGLLTIGSPRVLNQKGANALMAALKDDKNSNIYRIVNATDYVPLFPAWFREYKHVSGTNTFVTNKDKLVIGSGKCRHFFVKFFGWFSMLENMLGCVLPNQHMDLSKALESHSSSAYLSAIKKWKPTNKHEVMLDILPMFISSIKVVIIVLGAWKSSPYWYPFG